MSMAAMQTPDLVEQFEAFAIKTMSDASTPPTTPRREQVAESEDPKVKDCSTSLLSSNFQLTFILDLHYLHTTCKQQSYPEWSNPIHFQPLVHSHALHFALFLIKLAPKSLLCAGLRIPTLC